MKILPFKRKPTTRDRLIAGVTGGIAGAAAYTIVLQIDLKVFHHNTDDFALLGRLVSTDDARIQLIGGTMHFVNGAALGAAYGLAARDLLPGSPMVKGVTFAMFETVLLYPMAAMQRFHPGVREGRLDSYTTPVAFLQQVFRHLGYGAALGPVTERMLRQF